MFSYFCFRLYLFLIFRLSHFRLILFGLKITSPRTKACTPSPHLICVDLFLTQSLSVSLKMNKNTIGWSTVGPNKSFLVPKASKSFTILAKKLVVVLKVSFRCYSIVLDIWFCSLKLPNRNRRQWLYPISVKERMSTSYNNVWYNQHTRFYLTTTSHIFRCYLLCSTSGANWVWSIWSSHRWRGWIQVLVASPWSQTQCTHYWSCDDSISFHWW